jgi:hypothetical protein
MSSSLRASAPWISRRFLVCSLATFLAGCESNSEGTAPNRPTASPNAPDSTAKAPQDKPAAKPAGQEVIGDRLANLAITEEQMPISRDPSPFRFTDILKDSGIDFIHYSGMDEHKHFPTANGSGVAMFDYDNDGRLDLYFTTCTVLPLGTAQKGPNKLYKNLGDGKFKDVTDRAGVGYAGFCHGAIVGDFDNDGDQDLFLCNYGPNVLYLNNGNGTFKDISQQAGIAVPGWSSGGATLDYDNDGDLDLYVANYGEWKYPEDAHRCGTEKVPLYCSPREIRTTKHFLYRNNGDLTFTNVIDQVLPSPRPDDQGKSGARSDGHGFGVVTADLNGDGLIDIYVANDLNPNFLYLNKGNGTFEDMTEFSGAAFDDRGQAQSSMGVDAEDCDGDGRPELIVTNFQNEYNTYYQNVSIPTKVKPGELAPVAFMDSTASVGLAADSMPWVGWGCAFADFDNDGWPDLFVANGHVDNNRHLLGQKISYEEPPLLHRNVPVGDPDKAPPNASRRFKLSTRDVGPYFSSKHVARGAAFGDLDNDGDIDIVINHKDAPPALLRNDTPTDNTWIRLNLVGTQSNRDAVGARVEVETGQRTIYRQRKGGYSMESANDPRLLIGLGNVKRVSRVTIRWPSRAVSTLEQLEPNKTYEVIEPKDQDGKPIADASPPR